VNTREIGQLTKTDRILAPWPPAILRLLTRIAHTLAQIWHTDNNPPFPLPHIRGTWLNAMRKHGNTVTSAQCQRQGANDIALKTRTHMRKVGWSANNIYEYFTNQPTDWRQKVRLDNELPDWLKLRFADKMTGALVT
jgi:hypothetical protein